MNYLEIVLKGYCIENNKKNLVDYFISEFKVAEKERFCSSNLFFGGCLSIVEAFNENLQSQIYEQQSQLNKYLVSAGSNKDQEFVDRFKEQIEYQKKEGITNFQLETGRILHLKKEEISIINNAIRLAQLQLNVIPANQTETEEEQHTFKNNFDNIEEVEVFNHFKTGLVKKGHLTEQELNEFLNAAFELETKPKALFKLKHTPTKQKIYTVFYTYYKDIAQKKHGKQKEYAALLGDYFEGYDTNIIKSNWSRDYRVKR